MPDLLLYCLLNVGGFLFFLLVWNLLPKPKPLDYTTIPGLKLPIASEEELPELSLSPGVLVEEAAKVVKKDEIRKGHLDDIDKFGSFQRFLERNRLLFGPLHSFWWSVRYVVVVSSEQHVKELKKYSRALLSISPLAVGSVLQGDPLAWSRVPFSSIITKKKNDSKPLVQLESSIQLSIASRGPFRSSLVLEEEEEDVERLQRVPVQLECSIRGEGVRAALCHPLVVAFNEEIEIDAHPVPPFIPILIHSSALVARWREEEVRENYRRIFHWIPGMEHF